ncbi:MAG: tRNA (cytidine(56)-2'-O)-methyltransferase [Thermoplasmata archaeon]
MATASSGSSRRAPRKPRPEVSVLRVGHRAGRDPRLTTHAALAARALGARRMFLHPPDPALQERVRELSQRWGGEFEVVGLADWRSTVRHWDGTVVHLTMYGLPLDRVAARIPRDRPILLVIGGAKVPSQLYQWARFNIAVGHEPHSEVAALALALDRILGLPGPGARAGARQWIRPNPRGKTLVERGRRE